MRFKILALIGILAYNTQASEIFSDKVKSFEIKPQVCIVKKIGDDCELATTVRWQLTEVMAVCLVKGDEPLQCWQDRKSIREKLALVLNQSTEVQLVDAQNDKLASEMLEVNAVNPKQRRRRLRPAWSLF